MVENMKDMKRKPEEMVPEYPMQMMNDYPSGLSICLTEAELEKLKLDDECEVGDLIHLFAMAEVTSISKNSTPTGDRCRIELQIKYLGCEDEEEEEEEKPKRRKVRNPYKEED